MQIEKLKAVIDEEGVKSTPQIGLGAVRQIRSTRGAGCCAG